MTISIPAFEEEGKTYAWWLNNGAFWFTPEPGEFGFELMPSECNTLVEEARKHLGCSEPVVLLELKDSVRPGLFITTSDITVTLLHDNITVEETNYMFGKGDHQFGQGLKKRNTLSYKRFAQLLEACYAGRNGGRKNMIQPLMGAMCSLNDGDSEVSA